ncbi:glutamate--cysteine ligase [Acetobacter estunensis NRIC 0472]|uniref:Glutamate--cysteine ligase n=1 Tax=Acetobacter estunensis TaxID=104097 RepID=A0A967B8M6_9PROT|nr:glutamate--cysteine ligase [Acetobacter estunensis]NHO54720.1 glutamate--cysteine ligase [Acetobacter estunensis]GBQ21293.1 glutamate--cysteine ligase [Acetobacter estunensis NRIC 0472]
MSNPAEQDARPITSLQDLVDVLASGCKPREDWRIGTEHEKFGFVRPEAATAERPAFSSPAYAPEGIGALLEGVRAEGGWQPIMDGPALIGLKGQGENAGGAISLEPAGQFELSGAPLASLHDTRAELERHFANIRSPARKLGLGFAPLGFHPFATRASQPWMPKSRYAIMRAYMPKVGSMGLDMMQRTCTVQVNLDFASEEDMRRKMCVSLTLQPVATALFANSPFYEGKVNGWLSNRANVWTDTDNNRSGMPDACFAKDFGFAKYVEWALDVPMYFIVRDGKLIDVAGRSFRAWLAGDRQDGLDGLTPTIGDFEDHLTTLFPDVRLKRFLEMRGADAGSPEMMIAQSALWVGLLYDDAALSAAESLVREYDEATYRTLRADVPARALNTPLGTGTVRDLAARMVAIATDGLRARGLRNTAGQDETVLLAPLQALVAGAPTQAERWLERYNGPWGGDVRRILSEAEI